MFDYSCNGPRLNAHRAPTKGEIRFGHGATHYKEIPVSLFECFIVGGSKRFATIDEAKGYANAAHKRTGIFYGIERHIKKWIVCPIDGLRYYR